MSMRLSRERSNRRLEASLAEIFDGDLYDDDDDGYASPTSSMHSSFASLEPNNGVQSPVVPHGKMPLRRSLRQSLTNAFSSPVTLAKNKISLSSPVRFGQNMRNSLLKKGESARNILVSPKKHRNHDNTNTTTSASSSWDEDFEIPPGTSKEEALAILLCKELEAIDL